MIIQKQEIKIRNVKQECRYTDIEFWR
jgi:hypothetical protein